MTDLTQGHTVQTYNHQLSQLRGLVLEMGELVVDQVTNSVKALCDGEVDLARQVAERDREVDELDMKADREIFRTLALRQPAGVDLRLVLALSKSVSELARAGNKAKRIARFAVRLHGEDGQAPRAKLLHHVKLMNDSACCMLERSLDALARMDVDEAVGVVKDDEALDREFDAGMRHLVTFMLENPSDLSRVLDMVLVLKALEAVGDYAQHIAEQVVFVAKGRDVRYLDPGLLENVAHKP